MTKDFTVFKMDEILVLGARGMVGSSIVRALKADGYENIQTPTRNELDLMCPFNINDYFLRHKVDYIFFAAARVGGIKANIDFPATFGTENMTMILNVFEAAAYHNVAKMLFLGSSCIYPRDCPQPMKEEHLLSGKFEPTNEMYAFSKAFGIKLCEAYNKQYKTNFISCQPPNIYGQNDSFHPEHSHVMAAMIRKFHEAKVANAPEVVCWGSGNARRELMYVDDLADVCIFLMNNYVSSEFINTGTNDDHSIKKIAETVAEIVGYTGRIEWDTSKPEGMPRKLMDSSKINALGWNAKMSLKAGIKKTYNWWLANKDK
jgi:GDP-L-fucose synthase